MCIIIDSDSRACKHASFNVSPASQVLTVILRQDERASPAAVQTHARQCDSVGINECRGVRRYRGP